jgi:enamine deaminase RidA (YjgF/YER057c/UK114 family)
LARRLISTGSSFEEVAGYSRVVVDGDWVFVSGCTGFDYAANAISDDVVEQMHQTFRNIKDALARAESALEDVVRVRLFVASHDEFKKVAPILGDYFRDIRPANTTLICGLADPRMKVEVEVTARARG